VLTLTGHQDMVTNLDFQQVALEPGSDGQQTGDAIASVSDDGTVKVYLIDTAALMG
jgi:hypothetical protein